MMMHLFPDIVIVPAGKPLVDTIPLAITLRQLAPLGSGTHDPVHSLNEALTLGFFTGVNARALAEELVNL
jgi:hypothetical protein